MKEPIELLKSVLKQNELLLERPDIKSGAVKFTEEISKTIENYKEAIPILNERLLAEENNYCKCDTPEYEFLQNGEQLCMKCIKFK